MRVCSLLVLALVLGWASLSWGAAQREQTVTLSWGAIGWIVLEVHEDLFLGVVTQEYFEPDTQTFRPLEATGNPIVVACNYPQGCALTLQAVGWQVPPEFPGTVPDEFLADLDWRISGTQYLPLGTGEVTVWQADGPAVAQLLVDYRYRLDIYDVPGQYSVTLLYTATAP